MKLSLECSRYQRKAFVPGTWEVRIRVVPSEVIEESRDPISQRKERGFYTKCSRWLLTCIEQERNMV